MKVRVNEKWYERVCDNNYIHVGLIGTVIEVCEDDCYGVEFDRYINGHTCGGEANDGCGWYFPKDCVDVIDDDEVTSSTLTDALMELIALYEKEANDFYEEFSHGDSEARQYAYRRVVEDLKNLLMVY